MAGSDGLAGLPWMVWGDACLVIAAVYAVIWPGRHWEAARRATLRYLVLRWAHAAVWLLLATACFLRASSSPRLHAAAGGVALVALPVYAVFVGVALADRRTRAPTSATAATEQR